MDNQITLLSANQIQPNGWLNESHIEINQSNKITSEDPIKRSAIRSESVEMDSEQVDGNDGGGGELHENEKVETCQLPEARLGAVGDVPVPPLLQII